MTRPLVATQPPVPSWRFGLVVEAQLRCKTCGTVLGWGSGQQPCAIHPTGCPQDRQTLCGPDRDARWVLTAGTDDWFVILDRSDTPPSSRSSAPNTATGHTRTAGWSGSSTTASPREAHPADGTSTSVQVLDTSIALPQIAQR